MAAVSLDATAGEPPCGAVHGLVMVEVHGAGRLCRLNRAHLAAEPLLALVELRGRLLGFLR